MIQKKLILLMMVKNLREIKYKVKNKNKSRKNLKELDHVIKIRKRILKQHKKNKSNYCYKYSI